MYIGRTNFVILTTGKIQFKDIGFIMVHGLNEGHIVQFKDMNLLSNKKIPLMTKPIFIITKDV